MTPTNPPRTGAGNSSAGNVREDLHRTVDSARKGAAGRVEGVAESIDAAAAQLDDEDMARMSGYVHDMATTLGGLAQDLREKSGDEMLRDVERMARNNPALFLGGSVALGFGMSRFARATRSRDRRMPVPLDQARTPDHGDQR